MLQSLPWILATLSAMLFLGAAILWRMNHRMHRQRPLPTEWALTARPVFGAEERQAHRQLRDALPHHIVLAKLPLVRFCQPVDPQQVRYWYELLGGLHVGFAICSANGRVLAAIDLDDDRSPSRRSSQIKRSVLAACRVRYLRCPAGLLPSAAELQRLVPQAARAPGATVVAARRFERDAHDAHDPAGAATRQGSDFTRLWRVDETPLTLPGHDTPPTAPPTPAPGAPPPSH